MAIKLIDRSVFSTCGLVAMLFVSSCYAAMNEKQFQGTLGMIRNGCLSRLGIAEEPVDGLKKGIFPEDNKDLKCYTLCVFQSGGVMTKKNFFNEQKVKTQIDALLPPERKEGAKKVWEVCKEIQNNYKDPCDRTFYSAKCTYEFDPAGFYFP